MLILTAADVAAALPMTLAIEAMREAFDALAAGRAALPLRTSVAVPRSEATMLSMPAALAGESAGRGALGAKLVTVVPGNSARGLPRIQAVVLLLDPESGQPDALLDGTSLTALRTGAASGLATKHLARPDAATVALFGAGAQARTQLAAVAHVRRITRVFVHAPTRAHAERLAADVAGQGPIPSAVEVADSAREAVRRADIICAATSSRAPVFNAADVRPGTHVNAVGSHTLDMREVDPGLFQLARVVVDQRAAALAEAGEVAAAVADGLLAADELVELGDVVRGHVSGRRRPEEITVFKSVGLAIQDLAAASAAVARARELGLGIESALDAPAPGLG
jgi:ornithine cyclodeaminase